VNEPGLLSRVWRKSSYSGADGGCIEVAGKLPGFIVVRDSKDIGGPRLTFITTEWTRFTSQLKASQPNNTCS